MAVNLDNRIKSGIDMEILSEKPSATYINMLLHEGRGCLCSASYELIRQHGKTDV